MVTTVYSTGVNVQELINSVACEQAERRKAVRVNDAVGLHIQRVLELPAAGQSFPTNANANANATVRISDKYSINGYAEVRRDHPAVTQYITDLEERIRELSLDNDELTSKPTHKVSLSVCGLQFSDKTLFVPGEIISLAVSLFPSGHRISVDAVIVSSSNAKENGCDNRPNYRAEFVRMSDYDRDVIEAHVDKLLTKRKPLED